MRIGILIILFYVIGVGYAYADKDPGEVFVTNNFKGQGVAVKWISRYVYFDNGCDIYRRESGGNWIKLNSGKLKVLTSIPNDFVLNEDEKNLHNFVTTTSYTEFQENIVRAFVAVKAIYNPDFAELVGIAYYDTDAIVGKSYEYKVIGFTSTGIEEEVGISKSIKCSAFSKTESPKEIELERKKGLINIVWEPELYRYYGVNVYRRTSDTEFEKITKTPRAIQKGRNKQGVVEFPEIFYQDPELDDKISYYYKFEAIDYFGQTSIMSAEFSAPAKDFDPPQAAFNFKPYSYALEQKVEFNWHTIQEEDLKGFDLYRSQILEGPYQKVNTNLIAKTDRVYVDRVPTPGHYYYYLNSIDESLNETHTGKVYVEVRDMVPPAAPSNLKAEATEGKISMSWNANKESDLKGYFIQRSLNDDDNSNNKFINVNSDPILETSWYQDLPSNIRNKFVYRVVAVDTNFNRSKPSINSLAQMPDVTPPLAPQIKEVVVSDNVLITWIPSVEVDVEGYNVYRRLKSDTSAPKQININLLPQNITSYTDRYCDPGKEYDFFIRSFDQNGNVSEFSNSFSGGMPVVKDSVTLVIQNAKVIKKKKQISIEWEISSEDNIRGFVIFKNDASGVLKPITKLENNTSYKSNVDPGIHQYQVRAYLDNGDLVTSEIIELELLKIEN